MTRPLFARAAACLAACSVTAVTLVLAPSSPHAQAVPRRAVDDSPLKVTLDTMTPSVIPRRGPITLRGEVTNRSDDTYTDAQVYLFHSATPITSRAGLAEAVTTDAATDVGGRVTDEGLYDEIGDLEPGETTSYDVTVRRSDLEITGDPGVYWVGTHVLGAVDGVRTGLAAGRARSFMPLMPDDAPTTDLSVVVPLRERVRRGGNGSLLGLRQWQRSLSDDGRLGRIGLFASGSSGPLTWLVDPAVIDAVRSVAADDPPLSTAPDGTGPGGDGEGEADGSEASTSPSAEAGEDEGSVPEDGAESGEEDGEGQEPEEELSPEAQVAQAWLDGFLADVTGDALYALPYGDIDVPAFTRTHIDDIVDEAERLSADTMAELDLDTTAAVAPPRGYLPARALARVDPGTAVLMSDLAFPTVDDTVLSRPDGTQVVLTDTAAAGGGPGPQPRNGLLALRQRILSDVALTSLAGEAGEPVVVTLPSRFDPGEDWQTADFFGGLDVPWLRQVDLRQVLVGGLSTTTTQAPLYPASQRDAHIPLANQLATQELGRVGRVYADLLTDNDSVADDLAKTGMLASSYFVRNRPGAAQLRARNTTTRVRRDMQQVVVDGPPFVRMTSLTGPISVTVDNQLDVPVTVALEARANTDGLSISTPDPIQLGPGQRTPVRLRADADSIGVHTVSLVATTPEGEAIGSRTQFSVRTSNVGTFVWFVVGGGAAVLALAIVIRLVRRIRAARAGSSGSDVDTDRTDAAAEPGTVPTTSATVGPSSPPTNAAEDVATGTAKPVEGATP